jgi:ankyrin repeat protein
VPHCALPGRGLQLADVKDSQGLTPLHMAASNPAPEVAACIIPLLLDHGADVHAEHESTRLGRVQPLHCAAANECTQAGAGAARQFLAAGADVNAAASGGWRPLHFAACSQSLNVVQAFLAANGVEINARDSEGRTAMHCQLHWRPSDWGAAGGRASCGRGRPGRS